MINNIGLAQDLKKYIGVICYTFDDVNIEEYHDVYTFDLNQYWGDPKKYIRSDLKTIASDCGRKKFSHYRVIIKELKNN